jgi:hypothetical protein
MSRIYNTWEYTKLLVANQARLDDGIFILSRRIKSGPRTFL